MKSLLYILSLLILFTQNTDAQTDTTLGLSVTSIYGGNYAELAAAICNDTYTDRGKANAIYNWITHNIAYDVKGIFEFGTGKDDKATKALKNRKAICAGYSELYARLCMAAGLNAVIIDGYAKDIFFDNGDQMYIPRHEWNAVKINGNWELVDATWGAGGLYMQIPWWKKILALAGIHAKLRAKDLKFKYHYDPQYFAQNPELFRLKHLPLDPMWQLTDTALSLAAFEAGDSAIKKFNELSKPAQSAPKLDEIATLPESQKTIDMADRAYAYNNRCHVVLAYKNLALADTALKCLRKDMAHKTMDSLLKSASANMKDALERVKKQKKTFPEEYSKLGKKNKSKSADAKRNIQHIKADDKRLIAETKRHTKSAQNKYARVRKKAGEVQRRKSGLNKPLEEVETAKAAKKRGAPELQAIDDSITAREVRQATILAGIAKMRTRLDSAVKANSTLLEQLALSLKLEDSMLRNEAVERLGMHDDYDDEVKKWNHLFKQQKYATTDTLVKYYFAGCDSIAAGFGELNKIYVTALNNCKNNVKDLQQYKKKNDGGSELRQQYDNAITDYSGNIDSATNVAAFYLVWLKTSQKVFSAISQAGKHQLKIVTYMERAEKNRQDLESRALAHKKSLDIRENDHQRSTVQNIVKKLEKARSAI